jgi:hypothetical protein
MSKSTTRRLGVCVALLAAVAPALLADKPREAPRPQTYQGKVVPLADLVAKEGGRLDPDAAPFHLVLVTDDGKAYPLVKDAGARAFFKDAALLNRPMQLTATPLPGSQVLRVLVVRSVVKGQPCDVYYWCDVCAIRRNEKDVCECCGGPMKLVEEPVGR